MVTAELKDGPVGRALLPKWNDLHDLGYDLESTLKDYDDAAHFQGGPAQRDAEGMIKKIQAVTKELEDFATDKLNALVVAEANFVKKYGEPSEYADQMRAKVFPR